MSAHSRAAATHFRRGKCNHENTKAQNGKATDMPIRMQSTLSDELEDVIHRTIGCCITVHTALGPGLLESIYSRAVAIELEACNLKFEREKLIPVVYREQLLWHQRIDIIVAEQLILEIKAVERLVPVNLAQVLTSASV